MDQLASRPPAVDSVHLSPEAVLQHLHQISDSLDVATEKVRDQIADIAASFG